MKQYARIYREEYPGGIFWVSADNADSIETSFRDIATVDLKMEELAKETEINVVIGRVLKWFQQHQNWLILYNNADDLKFAPEEEEVSPAGQASPRTRFVDDASEARFE